MRLLAVDPGEICGIAIFDWERPMHDRVHWPRQFDDFRRVQAFADTPAGLYDEINRGGHIDHIVVEEYRLYPWLARQQGFTTFPTVEVIGVVKYLAATRGISLTMQRADVKKAARKIGLDWGFAMKERKLGSGKGAYRGPDFDIPGKQHPRDAIAHGLYWIARGVEEDDAA